MHGFRMSMEDCHTIAPALSDKFPQAALFAVFDGHAGDRAAIFLEAELHKRIAALENPFDEQQLSECVQKLDADFISTPARDDGSTCTLCVVHPIEGQGKKAWEVIACNVGDSRSMIIRKDTGECVSLTEDHKPEDARELARITAAGGTVSMNRVDGQLAMSRAIGDFQYKRNPQLSPEEQKVIAVPEIKKAIAYEGDHLLVCCDGIVEQMSSEEAVKCAFDTLTEQGGEVDNARVMLQLNKYSLQRGSKDNHSCMLVTFCSGESYAKADEFVAGPYHPYQNDSAFKKAYLGDAKKHGYEGEALFELARQTEQSMPELQTTEAKQDEGAGGGGGMGLQALQALINQPGDVSEKLMMLSSMLSGGGGAPGAGEEDGEDDADSPTAPLD